jgi:hypothetical protein
VGRHAAPSGILSGGPGDALVSGAEKKTTTTRRNE